MEIDYAQFEHELQVPLLPAQAGPAYSSNSAYGAQQSHMPAHLQNQGLYMGGGPQQFLPPQTAQMMGSAQRSMGQPQGTNAHPASGSGVGASAMGQGPASRVGQQAQQ